MSPPTIQSLARARWRIALSLTGAMVVLYFGFILLIAYNRPLLAQQIVPGSALAFCLAPWSS
jgi:uncharacterized membrane protein (DUF485 family)